MKNTIAMIAKGYAVVNGCAGAVLAALMSEILGGLVAFCAFLVILVASFFIYCIGEGIQLLQDIKDNAGQLAKRRIERPDEPEELPSI